MRLFTKDIKTMDDLFLHTLRDIYYAENKIVKSLPEMIETGNDVQLKQGLQAHLGETEGQVMRLEEVFQVVGAKAGSVDCPAIDGIIEEAEEVYRRGSRTTMCSTRPSLPPHKPSNTTRSPATERSLRGRSSRLTRKRRLTRS